MNCSQIFQCNEKEMEFNDIKEKFEKSLYGGYNIAPDLLIRTSGEIRLSNFFLYQCRNSMIVFENKNWPEMTLLDFAKILIRYQLFNKSQIQE